MAKEVAVGLEEGASLVARAEKGLEVNPAGMHASPRPCKLSCRRITDASARRGCTWLRAAWQLGVYVCCTVALLPAAGCKAGPLEPLADWVVPGWTLSHR
jgi:hypothetical protein